MPVLWLPTSDPTPSAQGCNAISYGEAVNRNCPLWVFEQASPAEQGGVSIANLMPSHHFSSIGNIWNGRCQVWEQKTPAPTKEDDMSSDFYLYFPESLMRAALRFRYVDFMIKSTPAISLAFIVYVTIRGVVW
jgi:hypothetical protein